MRPILQCVADGPELSNDISMGPVATYTVAVAGGQVWLDPSGATNTAGHCAWARPCGALW